MKDERPKAVGLWLVGETGGLLGTAREMRPFGMSDAAAVVAFDCEFHKNVGFHVVRGKILEFKSAFTARHMNAREVPEDWRARVQAADDRVEAAKLALGKAREARQKLLASCLPHAKLAKVPRELEDFERKRIGRKP